MSVSFLHVDKGFISVISLFSGDFHIQGSGRESKCIFHTHVHTPYTIPDLLAGCHDCSWRPSQRKFPPPTTQRQGGQERYTRCTSSKENMLWRPYVPANFHCTGMCRSTGSAHPCPSSPHSLRWLPVEWFTPHYVRRLSGSCCCLLILSFTYNRRVLFTNRIQNIRYFIMSLLCVITNAAGRLPWLPLCRLLPGLRHTALPCHQGHTLAEQQQKQKPPQEPSVNFISGLFHRNIVEAQKDCR